MDNIAKLENKKVSFSFDRDTGSLVGVRNLLTDTEILSAKEGSRLFRLMIPKEDWPGHYADSHSTTTPDFIIENQKMKIVYKNVLSCEKEKTGIDVEVHISLQDDASEAIFEIKIENKGTFTIEEVRAPWLGGLRSVDGSNEDIITIGSQKTKLKDFIPHNPHTFERWAQKRVLEYPFPLMLPYADISSKKNGLGYICYDKKLRNGALGVERLDPFEKEKTSLSLSWAFSPFISSGEDWTSCPIGIFLHNGDWHDTADQYRKWLETWWHPAETPASLKESLGIGNVQFTSFSGEKIYHVNDYPQLADEFLAAGINHILIWNRAGGLYTVNGTTKEIMDESPEELENFRKALAEAQKKGINTSIIMNLRLVKEIFAPYKELGGSEAIRAKDGSPASRETYSCTPYHLANLGPAYNRGDSVTLCQRADSPFARRANNLIDKMLDLGFTSIFIDQPVNNLCCFNKEHNHSSPDAAAGDILPWLKEVSDKIKAKSKEGYLIGELPEVHESEIINLWWHWPWCSMAPEVIRYTMPDSLQLWVLDNDLGELNKAFALGFYACLIPCGLEKGMASRPKMTEHCAKLAKLRKLTADYTVNAQFIDEYGLKIESEEGVIAKVYKGKQSTSVIIAETRGVGATANIQLNKSELGLSGETQDILYDIDSNKTEIPGGNLSVELKPYDVKIWTL